MKYLLILTLLLSTLEVQSQDCCTDVTCIKRTKDLSSKINTIFIKLDKPPNGEYTFQEIIDQYADSLNYYETITLEQIYKELKAYYFPNDDLSECLISFIIENQHIYNWLVYFRGLNTPPTDLPSPNFRSRFSLFVNTNFFGVTDLFKDTESYMGNLNLLLGTTIGRDEPKFRVSIGGTVFYQYTNLDYLISARIAYKITDIEPALVNIGTLKVHIQSNFNQNIFMLESGISFETYAFGINILNVGYQSNPGYYYLYSGFSFNLVDIF